MPTLVANAPLNEADLLSNGDLTSLFANGSVTTSTSTTVVVYDPTTTERLTLHGTFTGADSKGFPTGGTITSLVYDVNGVHQLSASSLSASVTAFDSYVASNDFVGLFANVFSGNDSIRGNDGGDDVLYGFAGNDTILGYGGNDVLHGFEGRDTLYGGAGNDSLDGGADPDKMLGGTGDDTYWVDNQYDAVYENSGEGTDTVYSTVSYGLRANVENLNLYGTGQLTGKGNDLANVIHGNDGADRLYGYGGDDTLVGGAGRDILDGGTGNDTMSGGGGNDVYVVDSTSDTIVESAGAGTDFVRASVSYTLSDNVERLYQSGTADIDATGNALANLLVGNSGANHLSGMDGNDHIYGGMGNDTLDGGLGNDYLEGGAGQDLLIGGDGKDYFVFRDGDTGATMSTADEIQDFTLGDRFDVAPIDANTTVSGNQAFTFVGTNAFDGAAGELRYEQVNGDTYISGDTNGDGTADFMVKIDGLHDFTTSDLVL